MELVPTVCLVARFIFKRSIHIWGIFSSFKGIARCPSESYLEKLTSHSVILCLKHFLELLPSGEQGGWAVGSQHPSLGFDLQEFSLA